MQKNSKIVLGVVLAGIVLSGALVALVFESLTSVPNFKGLFDSVEYPIKLANGDKSMRRVGPHAAGWAPVSEISDHLLMAVIASEDTSFFSHKGVDFYELKEAVKKDWKEKRWARGASTLTQQVVKNIFLDPEKTVTRKIKEILWARELEKNLNKTQILCLYVNMAEWGPGIYGVKNASLHYFGIAPSELSAKQSAFLAMLLPSPVKYHSYFVKKQLTHFSQGRINQILNVMNSMGFLEDADYEQALAEELWPGSGAGGGSGAVVDDENDDEPEVSPTPPETEPEPETAKQSQQ